MMRPWTNVWLALCLASSTFVTTTLAANSVSLNKSCYLVDEPFIATFSVTTPMNHDWVGIMKAGDDPFGNNVNYLAFSYTCGSTSCTGSAASGTIVIFQSVTPGAMYKAVLLQNDTFKALAVSSNFRVATSCSAPTPVRNPTKSPTRQPTTRPVANPTRTPTKPASPTLRPVSPTPKPVAPTTKPVTPTSTTASCLTSKTSYAANEAVTVTFRSPSPLNNDFIGIFPASAGTVPSARGSLWLWTCNRQGNFCSSAVASGSVTFSGTITAAWTQQWPLPAGQYRAFLMRNGNAAPFQVVATSPLFTVQGSSSGSNDAAFQALQQVRQRVLDIVNADSTMPAQLLRMAFHDCVGGCDGCIDMTNPENRQLNIPISRLAPIVAQFATPATGISRADVWAQAVTVAVDSTNHGRTTRPISFTMNWFGRVNCEDANTVCRKFDGSNDCSPTGGPDREIPGVNLNSKQFFDFFANDFNFTKRQAVTIMGAHTIGRSFKLDSGITGPDGWVIDQFTFDNEYYRALMGAATSANTDQQKVDLAPGWVRAFESNAGSPTGRPDRHFWTLDVSGKRLIMTNSDMCVVREFNTTSMNPTTGAVSCTYTPKTGTPACPFAPGAIGVAAEFSDNNDKWLSEFKVVFDFMLTNGYRRPACSSSVCKLQPK